MEDRVSTIGLLTTRDLDRFGAGFGRAYPVDETACFGELLRAIDAADCALLREPAEAPLIASQGLPTVR